MRFASLSQLESNFLSTGNNAEYNLKEISIPVPGENLTLQGVLCTPAHRTGYFHDSPHPKERVLLHFTAGQIRSDMQALTRQDFHVSVPFVIGRNGTIYQLYSSKFWSGNIGKGRGNTANEEDKKTIGIEISNYGFLTEREGNLETIYSRLRDDQGRTGPVDIYCSLSERQAYQKVITPFREQSYYATFTPEQYESLIILLRYLTATYNIPRQFLPGDKRFIATDDVLNFKGIVSHVNYRDSGKWDIGPAFDWTRVVQGVQAASFTPSVPATRGVMNGDVIHSEEELENLLPKSKSIQTEEEELLDLENARVIENEAQKKNLYALIVGINDYQETVKVGEDKVYFPRLNGCVDDAMKVQQYLEVDRFYEPVIRVLKNAEATKKAVVDLMIEHLGQATDNDTILLYFSGHGTQEKTDKEVFASETDEKLECIACYYDENTKDDFLLSDKELRWLIHKIANNKPHIVTIFDCCHSGNNTRNAALLSNSFPHSIEKRIAYVFPERNWDKFIFSGLLSKEQFITEGIGKLLPEGKHFQFSACESYESAIELDNEGVFTKTLLRTLKDSGGDLTYQSLGSRIRQYMRNVFAQKPKIDCVGGDVNDLNKIFLNKPFSESKKAFGEVTYNVENGWQLNLGAINGIGKNATSIEIMDAANPLQVAKATISSIGVDYTILRPDNELDPTKIYVTNIEGLTSESLRIHFDMEGGVLPEQENIFNELQKELPKSLLPEDDEPKAQYVLRYSNNQYYFTLPGNKYQPLVKLVEAGQADTAVKLARDLKHIGSWEFLKNLTNEDTATQLSDKVLQVDFTTNLRSPSHQTADDGDEIIVNYNKESGLWKSAIRVKMTNLGEKDLYCACLWLTSDFGSSTELLDPPVKSLEGSARKIAGSPPDVEELRYKGNSVIPVSFDKVVKWYNWPNQIEYLKFIISTEPFDVKALQLEGLPRPLVPGKTKGLGQTRGIGDDVSANPTGWFTKQIKLVFPNPEYNTISEPDLNSMLNNPEMADFALGLYFEGETNGLITSHKMKPEVQVIGQNTRGAVQDKIIDLANWWSRTKRNRHFEDAVKRFPDRVKIVSEGDSWFQHPLVLDIIDHLHPAYNIFCVAAAGDTLRNYFSAEKNNGEYYLDAIEKHDPAFFLISGGGNDILGSQFSTYLTDKPDHIGHEGETPERFLKKELMDEIATLMGFYKTLFEHLQTHKPNLNIIVHGYDYPIKLNDAKKGWLGKYMIAKGIDRPGDRKAIIRHIMDAFNSRLSAVCQDFDKVAYIDVRNMVRYNEQEKVDQWYDEIHPTNEGFQQIAMKFMETIDAIARKGKGMN